MTPDPSNHSRDPNSHLPGKDLNLSIPEIMFPGGMLYLLMHHSADMMAQVPAKILPRLQANPSLTKLLILHELCGKEPHERKEMEQSLDRLFNRDMPADSFQAFSHHLKREEGYPPALIELARELRAMRLKRDVDLTVRLIDLPSDHPSYQFVNKEEAASEGFHGRLFRPPEEVDTNFVNFKSELVSALKDSMDLQVESFGPREEEMRRQIRSHASDVSNDTLVVVLVGALHEPIVPWQLRGGGTCIHLTRPMESFESLGLEPLEDHKGAGIRRLRSGGNLSQADYEQILVMYGFRGALGEYARLSCNYPPEYKHLGNSACLNLFAAELAREGTSDDRAVLLDQAIAFSLKPENRGRPVMSSMAQFFQFTIAERYFPVISGEDVSFLFKRIGEQIAKKPS